MSEGVEPEAGPGGDGAGAWVARAVSVLLGAAAWAVQRVAAAQPARVETDFSRGAFPAIAGALSCASDVFPFAVAEALVVLLVVGLGFRAARLARRRRGGRVWRTSLALLADLAALGGLAVFGFVAVWGLNYQRQPFAVSAGYSVRPSDATELELLSVELVEIEATDRAGLPEDAAGVLRLPDGVSGTLARVGEGFARVSERYPFLGAACGRPKAAWASPLLSRLGIAGVYVPFTGEPLVDGDLPAPELPFSASHEVAHRRGIAREDEANYVGYLACRQHPDPVFRYSGAFAATSYALAALSGVDREAWTRVWARRSAPVRRDAAAVRAWAERWEGRATEVSRQVNDAYLRSQGESRGVRSYGRMVDLLLAERRARTGSQ